jgi:TusA-related sulfurtransferase
LNLPFFRGKKNMPPLKSDKCIYTASAAPKAFRHGMEESAKTGQKTELLDVRGVAAPENVLSILKRASELPPGAVLEIRMESNPWQLYDLLQQRGYFLQMERQKDGSFFGEVRQREIDILKH